MTFAAIIALVVSLAVHPSLGLALQVPQYKGYVNDYAGMIAPRVEARIEQMLFVFDRSDSTQIAILTIPSLEGDSLEGFSIRTVEAWKIGQKKKDNGVLLLVAKKERKVRIEVGRGLEPVLTDLASGRIIDLVITPYFKANRFDAGFESGVGAIIQATRGEFTATQPVRSGRRRGSSSPLFTYLVFGVVLINVLGKMSRPLGAVAGGLILPLVLFLGLATPIGWLSLLLFVPLGALGGFVLPLLFANAALHRSGVYWGGGMGGGGFGGFGGGGFGGGGASGGW